METIDCKACEGRGCTQCVDTLTKLDKKLSHLERDYADVVVQLIQAVGERDSAGIENASDCLAGLIFQAGPFERAYKILKEGEA